MPGLTFLFWNTNRRSLDARVEQIVLRERPDLIVLAEPGTVAGVLATQLSQATGDRFHVADGSAERFTVFSRLTRRSLRLHLTAPRQLIYRLLPDSIPELLLSVVHLPSKLHAHDETQGLSARELVADLIMTEDKRKHTRTVVTGDLNMNPFELGVAGAGGLHGVMSQAVAARERRQIQTREYRMFYNPMWSFMGDRSAGPAGTYYRSAAEAVNYYWNTFDQVLLRPELAGSLTDIKVLTTDGVEPLLSSNGVPDAANGSDHLPLVFRLEW